MNPLLEDLITKQKAAHAVCLTDTSFASFDNYTYGSTTIPSILTSRLEKDNEADIERAKDNEVTHAVFFGENLKRVFSAFSKK